MYSELINKDLEEIIDFLTKKYNTQKFQFVADDIVKCLKIIQKTKEDTVYNEKHGKIC